MKPLGVVELKVPPEAPGKIWDGFVFVEVEPLVLEAPPQAFHEDVIQSPAPAIHADLDIPFLQWSEESFAGELASLIRVEDLGLPLFEGFLEGFNAEAGIQGVRDLPGEDTTKRGISVR